jgi:hypothetical protein
MSGEGRNEAQNAGRSGLPNSRQRICSSSCTQGTPAGLPWGMPGIGEVIEGAMQQAPQRSRHDAAGGLMAASVEAAGPPPVRSAVLGKPRVRG